MASSMPYSFLKLSLIVAQISPLLFSLSVGNIFTPITLIYEMSALIRQFSLPN